MAVDSLSVTGIQADNTSVKTSHALAESLEAHSENHGLAERTATEMILIMKSTHVPHKIE